MAFQFVHVSTYSVKSGGAGIAAEAGRKPDNCRHVDDPKPPVLLAGVDPLDAWTEIERRHAAAKREVQTKTGPKLRGLRKDELILLAAVASWPGKTSETDVDSPEFRQWIKDVLEWFTKQHGKPLSAVLHCDESHPHVHFLTAPDLEGGETIADIHPGERAKRDQGGRSGKKTAKDAAYKAAMREYQDSAFKAWGMKNGQARLGPKRQRLTRDQWMAQQAELGRFAKLSAAAGRWREQQRKDQQAMAEAQSELKARQTASEAAEKALKARETRMREIESKASSRWAVVTTLFTFGKVNWKRRLAEASKEIRLAKQEAAESAAALEKAQRQAEGRRKAYIALESDHLALSKEVEQLRPLAADHAGLVQQLGDVRRDLELFKPAEIEARKAEILAQSEMPDLDLERTDRGPRLG